ncbi:BrnT family toxin [Treponema primitia]|uniref:BrnT family toxin n=1 Tax=Treponema primitia TaxID=88058 RepID=UPI0002554F16|nr:BrnT family toxin [Treponema primitia]
MTFTWDTWKNRKNIRKHGVSFQEAALVFEDRCLWDRYDPSHSVNEEWYIVVGSARGRILYVVFTEPDQVFSDTIRIISARRANKREKEDYYGNGAVYPGNPS